MKFTRNILKAKYDYQTISAVVRLTRSSAVAVIAGRNAYDVLYSYRLAGIAVISMSIYSFTVQNKSLLLMLEVLC